MTACYRQVVLTLLPVLLCHANSFAQYGVLKNRLHAMVRSADGDIGIAVMGLEDNDTISVHGAHHYPMQSVYKLHLGMAVLQQIEEKRHSLQEQIHVTQKDLLPTYSPLRKEHPEGEFDLTLKELVHGAVSLSDNNACDILFRLIGGTQTVNDYIHNLGINDVSIVATEEEMSRDWNVQFTNWTTPRSALQLLEILYRNKALSPVYSELLLKEMRSTPRGNNRIKGLLPAGTVVAHKPGTSNTNEQGVTAATNDIGIVTLPSGKHVALAIFVSNSKSSDDDRAHMIAELSKVVWDYFNAKK